MDTMQGLKRTHYCGDVEGIGNEVVVGGYVQKVRDLGNLIFIDLRDRTGIVQLAFDDSTDREIFEKASDCHSEYVLMAKGVVRERESKNTAIKTGNIEIDVKDLRVLAKAQTPPFEIVDDTNVNEELRLKYRYLDLRRKVLQDNLIMRSKIAKVARDYYYENGFIEIETPMMIKSTPEGARDYLIPSRKHKGMFYALPQAPQIFKQLLMVSGFDKYFQVAPCFRDEDARADRSPGEFYQLDFEMAFAEQDDVFAVAEEVLYETFSKFSDKEVSKPPFRRIPFAEAMITYGTDKPDLRNPLLIKDISDMFVETDFAPFRGKTVRSINVPNAASQSKSWFKKMEEFALSIGMKGLGYVKVREDLTFDGPIDKFLKEGDREKLIEINDSKAGDVIYFIADSKELAPKLAGQIRTEVAERLSLIDKSRFDLCFITDFPMYEHDEDTGAVIFTHNPFSMPQGGMEALLTKDPCDVLAYQYDIVCNGIELSSGAVRNHDLDIMVKAFEIAGYTEEDLQQKFSSLYRAFKYGAPPHAGMAPGIDRMLMLLTDEENIREVIAFPMNSNAQDVLLGAPNEVTEQQLREIHIKIR